MGYNTDVIIIVSHSDRKHIHQMNLFFYEKHYGGDSPDGDIPPLQEMIERYRNCTTGNGIFHGDFKYLDREEFLKHLENIPWTYGHIVQVLLRGDEQIHHSLYTMDDSDQFVLQHEGE